MDQMYGERNILLLEKKQLELDLKSMQESKVTLDEKILENEKTKSKNEARCNAMALKLRELGEQASMDKREFDEFK